MGESQPAGGESGRGVEFEMAAELRRLRQEERLSVGELAIKVGYSREHVSKAERPGRGLASAPLVDAIDAVIGADGALIALRARAAEARRARRARHARPAAAPRLGRIDQPPISPAACSAALLAEVVGTDIDTLTIDDVEERVDALGHGYYATSPDVFTTAVTGLRERVRQLLTTRATLRQRRRLYAALAALTAMLAESCFALGQPTEVHCACALGLVEEAGHTPMAGWVRGTQAQIALHTGSPAAAARYATAGLHAPSGSTSRVRAATYLARASARLGDRATAHAAWRTAQHAWADLGGSLTESVFSLSPDYLSYCELTMEAWLGDPTAARRLTGEGAVHDPAMAAPGVELLTRSLAARGPAMARSQAFELIALGAGQLLAGDRDAGVTSGNRALDLAADLRSRRVHDRLAVLTDAAERRPNGDTRDLTDRIRALTAA